MIPTFMLGNTGFVGSAWSTNDPYWTSVVFLARMEGADTGSTFVDSGPLGFTIENTGGFTTSATQFKFGTTSCRCDGSGGRLRFLNTSGSELAGDFTIECFAYWTATPITVAFPWGMKPATNAGPTGWTDGKLYFDDSGDKISGTTTVTNNAWHHIAVTRSGTTIKMWLDGVQAGSTYTSSATYCGSGTYTYIGSVSDGNGMMGFGTTVAYLDNLRITKGVVRYTGTFTPPTVDF